MLIDKPLSKGDICTIKLSSGEEVVATFEDENDTTIVVSKATCLAQMTGPDGKPVAGFAPWLLTANPNKVSINKSTTTAIAPATDEAAKGYTDSTSTIARV